MSLVVRQAPFGGMPGEIGLLFKFAGVFQELHFFCLINRVTYDLGMSSPTLYRIALALLTRKKECDRAMYLVRRRRRIFNKNNKE